MDFDGIKKLICDYLSLDPDNLPDGVRFTQERMFDDNGRPCLDLLNLWLNEGSILEFQLNLMAEAPTQGQLWIFDGIPYLALIKIGPEKIRKKLGLDQPPEVKLR